jgi:hypothetical protein
MTGVAMSMSICEKTTTLIFFYLQLVDHFIDGIGIATTSMNATTILILVLLLLLVLALSNCSTVIVLFFC